MSDCRPRHQQDGKHARPGVVTLAATATSNAGAVPSTPSPWLIGPWVDCLFLANVTWPLIFLWSYSGGLPALDEVQFWQVYFVTTPHRWITLVVVFLDTDHYRQRRTTFAGIAIAAVVICLLVRVSTGTLTCLLAIDYLWNSWHFAAQHHGIFRIYGRAVEPQRTRGLLLEKVVMRAFLVYVILRVAGGSWAYPRLGTWLHSLDWAVLLIPICLAGRELLRFRPVAAGRLVYLTSVLALYSALLVCVHWQRPRETLMLATASALFHATEYLTTVSWAVRRKHAKASSRQGVFFQLAATWGLSLAIFVAVLGSAGWLIQHQWMEFWLLCNVIVAYLHYTYDGMIWKTRRPSSYAS